ncbi:MAG: glycoside hydrolase family 88 protein [Sedimentisphaerales bacterium]|nr:glycoside hydrolase family 88 protein [Sedimentisphaerales bacterium]
MKKSRIIRPSISPVQKIFFLIAAFVLSLSPSVFADPNLYNNQDLAEFANEWLGSCSSGNGWCNGCDYDISGTVDEEDLARFANLWLTPKDPVLSDDIAAWIMNNGVYAWWSYDRGVLLLSLYEKWLAKPDPLYLKLIKDRIDSLVDSSGNISWYSKTDYNLDNIQPGNLLFILYEHFGENKYLLAADKLIDQLVDQPTTFDGGYWHKQKYHYQMWLDGVYMAEPFACRYAQSSGDANWFDETGFQINLIATHTQHSQIYGSGTGLCYHGWDGSQWEDPPQDPCSWADPTYGHSPEYWGRAQGWYAMALVDCLDLLPPTHSARTQMLATLSDFAAALDTYQDPNTGLWWQITDKGYPRATYPENYTETSCSAMFSYALGRAVEAGYLPEVPYLDVSRTAFEGLVEHKLSYVGGYISLKDTVQVGSLSGAGDYDYYMSVGRVTNDYKGIAPFMRAALVYERMTP